MVVRRLLLFACSALLLMGCASSPDTGSLSEEEQLGQRLFASNCASCHAIQPDTVIVGPSMSGITDTASQRVPGMSAEGYIRESILDPGAYLNEGYQDLMPATFGKTLSEKQVDALVAFLLTLHANTQ